MRIFNVVGARPNFIKIAPLMRAMKLSEQLEPVLVHTGQHYDRNMSASFFEDLQIPRPDYDLGVGSGPRNEQITKIMARFEPLVVRERPNLVLVVGDVNSTVACARVAKSHGVAIAHVEAGLRSFDESMPEELNRIETDGLSDFLFVTEPSGMKNLENERVRGRAVLVGNVMIDSLCRYLPKARSMEACKDWGAEPDRYALCTFHRPSNVDTVAALENILKILEHTASRLPTLLPLHPRTEQSLRMHGLYDELAAQEQTTLLPPQGYLDFISLLSTASAVITDSGGIQEESTYLRIPCITMRDNTERPVTVDIGSNFLAGTSPELVTAAIDRQLGRRRASSIPDLWDGHAAERIVAELERALS